MTTTVKCDRCSRESAALETPPIPGPVGAEVQQRVCSACWVEWQQMEVMVINEFKLNFMEPSAQAVLDQHMREFLGLLPAADETP